MINAITYAATTIQFPAAPLREGDEAAGMVQTSALASDGALYVYNKALHYRVARSLTYTQVSDATLAALRALHATLDGGRNLFVWYDHLAGAGHNCRFTAPLKHLQTGPNRHRIEIELEELLPLALPAVASWASAAAAVSGSFPCWIFRLTVNGIDYWLSDHIFPVTGGTWNISTLPLVKSWGSIQSGITGGLSEYKVSGLSVDLLIDPAASPNLRDLSLTYELEQYPVELYLWFHGLNAGTDPPRLKWKGYIRNHPEMDDTTLRLECEDETARLSKNIGTLLDVRSYPEAAKADVGKVFPIVFGDVRRLPLLGIDVGPQTTLPAAISAATTAFDLSDATDFSGSVIVIDDEHMVITSVAGNTVGVQRGINNTLAATHSRGAVVWEFRTNYLYACEAVDSISQVYGKIGEQYLNITSVCVLFPGLPGTPQHYAYPGLAIIALPGLLSVAQLDSLGVARSGLAAQAGNIQDYSLTDPGHYHNAAVSTGQATISQLPSAVSVYRAGDYGMTYSQKVAMSFPAEGARATASYSITLSSSGSYAYNGVPFKVFVGGVAYYSNTYDIATPYSMSFSFSVSGDVREDTIEIYAAHSQASFSITAASRTIQLTNNQSSTIPAGVNKNAANNGTLNVSDTIAAYLTGLSTVRSIISSTILCDLSRNVFLPPAVEQDLLTRAGGGALTTVGAFPAWYRLDGAITEYKSAQYWLDSIAFQCRAWFVKERGAAKLIVRPDGLTPIKTLPNCLLSGSKRSLKISKAALSEVINVMALRYDRDWSLSRSAENYRGAITDRMAESIAYYGERAAPADMFFCDFIRGYTMALHVMGYYLGKHSRRHRIYKFSAALDNEALQFGDAITLGFESGVQVVITAADLAPGAAARLDTIEITATDIHTEWAYGGSDYCGTDYYHT